MSCVEVHVIRLCGKDAIRYMRREVKENKRKRLLLRLIKEVRQLRRQANESK